jgi:hypothetical protein
MSHTQESHTQESHTQESHAQEDALGREIPRFEPWLGWSLLMLVPAAGMVVTPAAYDRPLIIATIVLLAIAAVSFLRQTPRPSRGAEP